MSFIKPRMSYTAFDMNTFMCENTELIGSKARGMEPKDFDTILNKYIEDITEQ